MTNFIFYHYDPILIGAVIASVLFLVITILYVVQLARYKAWFTLPLIVGGLCMVPLSTRSRRHPANDNEQSKL